MRYQYSLLCFSMFVVQIWSLYLVNRLLYGVLPETTFILTKTAEHDLSLTSITFDLGWTRIKLFQRMRRIDARRGAEIFKALFLTKFELLTKKHQGALAPPPPIRSRLNPRRHRGVDATPLRFFWNIFFVNRSIVTIFSIAFRPSFLRPPWKFQDPDPLTLDLWRHNWGHVRRKMRSVAHNLQTSPFLLVIWKWTCSNK